MTERFEISFTEGGVGAFETIITGGLAEATEKALDAISGDENHGWYCNIRDTITDLKVTCWGATKGEAQEKAHQEIKSKIEDFEDEQERVYAENKEKEKLRQRQIEQANETHTSSSNSSSDESGCATLIAWLVGIGIVVFVVIWLAVNVVLPVALLNSALALAILSFVFRKYKTLFATLAIIGGGYMLLDITNGWLSVNFVEKVVKNPDWISAFVYINAAAIGYCVWSLVQPLWLKTKQIDSTEKNKSKLIKMGLIILIIFGMLLAPFVYHSVQNPFVQSKFNFNFFANNKNTTTIQNSAFIVKINADALRGRVEPVKNTDNVLFILDKDIVLELLDEKISMEGENWYKVKFGSKEGWILGSYAIKIAATNQQNLNITDVQIKKMQFISYGCGDNCHLVLKDIQTNQDESFMFWSKYGMLKELDWDEEGKIEKKYIGNIYEVTLIKKYMAWSTLIGNEMVENKEWVWYINEMQPFNSNNQVNQGGKKEDKFSGVWHGHETHIEIKLNSDGTYKIEMSAVGNTYNYKGYLENGA